MSPAARRISRLIALLLLQALFWVGLTAAFASLINFRGWMTVSEAFWAAAPEWLPWAILAPIVFWLALRFPIERGRLIRNVPLHLAACLICVFAVSWLEMSAGPRPRNGGPPQLFGERRDNRFGEPKMWRKGKMDRMARSGASAAAAATGHGAATEEGGELAYAPPPEPGGDDREPAARGLGDRGPGDHRPGGRGPGERGGAGEGGPPRSAGWGIFGPGGFLRFNPMRANFQAALYLILVCAAHALGYYRRAQDREKHALALAAGLNRVKLDALRLQLHPHFLFNTLNAISTLVRRDPDAADELIGDLSELLRLSLETTEHEVPLARELELLDRYLAIEQTRLGSRLRVVREIDPAAAPALVPTFVLQPVVENAIRHGIEPRRAAGTVTIRARVEGDKLHLLVADDGVGLRPAEQRSQRRGIGLANTEERLRTLHGASAQLELVTPESGGVEVRIVLPVRKVAAKASAAPERATPA